MELLSMLWTLCLRAKLPQGWTKLLVEATHAQATVLSVQ